MQSPLIRDGALSAANDRIGVNNRIVEVNLATGARREFVYQLAPSNANGASNYGVSEIVAINEHQFLVIERDGRGFGRDAQNDARFKRIYLIDIDGATDVSNVANLPTTGLPPNVRAVTKSVFLDMLAATGLAATSFPEKLEGLAFGPDLPDGRRLLLVSVDNDFAENLPSSIFGFAIDARDLPGYQAQAVAAIPEPSSYLLTGLGLIALAIARVRRRH